MKRTPTFTAAEFSKAMGISRRTATRWLTAGIVPGAVLKESPDRGQWWEIPIKALTMAPLKPGPKPAEVRARAKKR